MPERLSLAACLAVALLLPAAPAQGAGQKFGDITVTVFPAPEGRNAHGYSLHRFTVSNEGDTPHTVRLTIPAEQPRDSRGVIAELARSAEVDAKSSVTFSIGFPSRPNVLGIKALVSVDGRQFERQLDFEPAQSRWDGAGRHTRHMGMMAMHSGPSSAPLLVLRSQTVPDAFFQGGGGGKMGGGFEGGGTINGEVARATSPVRDWADDWLAYSRYDGIILKPADLNDIADKPVLRALWRYVEAGGVLLVVGPGDLRLPKAWRSRPPRQRGAVLKEHVVGFGLCLQATQPDPGVWQVDDWHAIDEAFKGTYAPWQATTDVSALHESFPVVDNLGVPVMGLFVLMLVFAAVIGPVNLIVLTRLNRRIWMLWTVPLVSAATCIVVLVYMVFSEGWSGHARVAGITILDQVERRATTLGRSAYYSPLTPGDGLRFPADTEVAPAGADHTALGNRCRLEWSGEQHLSAGWVSARIPAHFLLRRSEADVPLRVSLRKNEDGTLSAVNALGADIRELAVADEAGNLYSCGPIAAGEKGALRPTGRKAQPPQPEGQQAARWPNTRARYSRSDWGMKDLALGAPTELVAPGTYLAVVEQTPFLQPGLRGAALRTAPSLVLGLFTFDAR